MASDLMRGSFPSVGRKMSSHKRIRLAKAATVRQEALEKYKERA
jgi:hypothetical protein